MLGLRAIYSVPASFGNFGDILFPFLPLYAAKLIFYDICIIT